MKHANYDTNGNILGFYEDEIHAAIPQPNIQLTDEQWQSALDGSKMVDIHSTTLIDKPPYSPTQEELNIQHNSNIISQIAEIESKQLRALRDAALRNDLSFIQKQDQEITTLRSQLIS